MSESTYFFLFQGIEPQIIKKSLTNINHSSILFRVSAELMAVVIDADISYYKEIQLKLSKKAKGNILLFENFEDFGWSYTLSNCGKQISSLRIDYDDPQNNIIPNGLTELELFISLPTHANKLKAYLENLNSYYDSEQIFEGPRIFFEVVGLSNVNMVSYEYLTSDPTIETRFENIEYIDHKKTKRMNRKKILDELIGKPLEECGYFFSEKWKEMTGSNTYLDISSHFRSGLYIEIVSHDNQSGYLHPRLITPFGSCPYYELAEGFRKYYLYKDESEYTTRLQEILDIFLVHGIPYLHANQMENIDIEEVFNLCFSPALQKCGFSPTEYHRDRRFFTFDIRAFTNNSDILLINLNYNNAFFYVQVDKMDPNAKLEDFQPYESGIIAGSYKNKNELMDLVNQSIAIIIERYDCDKK